MRPPNTTATRRNHPQPMARPATTSLTQWTPSSARLVATTMAMSAAPAANTARTARGRSRPSTSATADQQAAAAAVWPDGNEKPWTSISCMTAGRSRRTMILSRLLMTFCPSPTTATNRNTSRLRRRTKSAVATTASTRNTTHVVPKLVTTSTTSTALEPACVEPHSDTLRSTSCIVRLLSTRASSKPSTSDAANTSANAAVRRYPPAEVRSIRCSRKRRTFG